MDNLTGSMKDVAFATSPREFDLSYSTTLEEMRWPEHGLLISEMMA